MSSVAMAQSGDASSVKLCSPEITPRRCRIAMQTTSPEGERCSVARPVPIPVTSSGNSSASFESRILRLEEGLASLHETFSGSFLSKVEELTSRVDRWDSEMALPRVDREHSSGELVETKAVTEIVERVGDLNTVVCAEVEAREVLSEQMKASMRELVQQVEKGLHASQDALETHSEMIESTIQSLVRRVDESVERSTVEVSERALEALLHRIDEELLKRTDVLGNGLTPAPPMTNIAVGSHHNVFSTVKAVATEQSDRIGVAASEMNIADVEGQGDGDGRRAPLMSRCPSSFEAAGVPEAAATAPAVSVAAFDTTFAALSSAVRPPSSTSSAASALPFVRGHPPQQQTAIPVQLIPAPCQSIAVNRAAHGSGYQTPRSSSRSNRGQQSGSVIRCDGSFISSSPVPQRVAVSPSPRVTSPYRRHPEVNAVSQIESAVAKVLGARPMQHSGSLSSMAARASSPNPTGSGVVQAGMPPRPQAHTSMVATHAMMAGPLLSPRNASFSTPRVGCSGATSSNRSPGPVARSIVSSPAVVHRVTPMAPWPFATNSLPQATQQSVPARSPRVPPGTLA
eukprot:TRINITY_DN44127_c0_g1_i1.p1 TRINITY_DN44127_c0_g1~~TRINITY_DN44127_c0_g1_i1.p1  ORF type:complete len:571 (+),score=92.02 TRINITY_DN44127_c0_g1_i1:103-1815(+)